MSILTGMYRGTTPTVCLALITSQDISEVEQMWVTFKTPAVEITYTGDEISVNTAEKKIYVTMTQEETLSFGAGSVKVQVRYLTKDGKAFATDIEEVPVKTILMEGVLHHDKDESDGGSGDPDEGTGNGGSGEDESV